MIRMIHHHKAWYCCLLLFLLLLLARPLLDRQHRLKESVNRLRNSLSRTLGQIVSIKFYNDFDSQLFLMCSVEFSPSGFHRMAAFWLEIGENPPEEKTSRAPVWRKVGKEGNPLEIETKLCFRQKGVDGSDAETSGAL